MSSGERDAGRGRNLKIAFVLNLAFVLLEVAGGLWTNSIAILTDAVHDGGDVLSLGAAWYLQKLSRQGPDAEFTYGYRRFSSLGALVTGIVLVAGLAVVVTNAVGRLDEPAPVHAPGMLGIAAIGILVNGAAAWRLRGGDSLNEEMVRWHLLEDTLGWSAVLVGSGVMMVWDVPVVDPLLALLIAVIVLRNVAVNLKKVGRVFLQSAPPDFDRRHLERKILGIPGIADLHHLHTWSLDGERHVFSAHLILEAGTDRAEVVAVKHRMHDLLQELDFEHVTLEIELEGESCGAGTKGDRAENGGGPPPS